MKYKTFVSEKVLHGFAGWFAENLTEGFNSTDAELLSFQVLQNKPTHGIYRDGYILRANGF